MENKYPRKRRKDILDKIAEKLDLPRLLEYDDDSLFDKDINSYYFNDNKEDYFNNDMPTQYDNEELIDKLIMGELLNFGEVEELLERTLNEFKRTFSVPKKRFELVFREIPNNKRNSNSHRKIPYKNTYNRYFDDTER